MGNDSFWGDVIELRTRKSEQKNRKMPKKQPEPLPAELPKIPPDPIREAKYCKCAPTCKSRRRVLNGVELEASNERVLKEKPIPECKRRRPKDFFPNAPCPIRHTRLMIKEKHKVEEKPCIRICQADLELPEDVPTPYLRYAQLVKKLGASEHIDDSKCFFCECKCCCDCDKGKYDVYEAGFKRNKQEMKKFDVRMKKDYVRMRMMYD